MNYWYVLLVGIFIGGTLGTIATALIVSCRLSGNFEEQKIEIK